MTLLPVTRKQERVLEEGWMQTIGGDDLVLSLAHSRPSNYDTEENHDNIGANDNSISV